jgi:hypothetical protein
MIKYLRLKQVIFQFWTIRSHLLLNFNYNRTIQSVILEQIAVGTIEVNYLSCKELLARLILSDGGVMVSHMSFLTQSERDFYLVSENSQGDQRYYIELYDAALYPERTG